MKVVADADRQLTTAVLPWITKMRKNDKANRLEDQEGVRWDRGLSLATCGWIGGLCDNGGGCCWSVS
ncbi:hypothetical protein T4E_6821 [Trichinella pseudospiralis]|uniref:Uncharacterized protein n=1 Tax=Trichinella pseudospiralis TaxID=6337 RepID=A0A0V0YCS8_TRIPS|nr:hypothetical protein T4E_6821 [Trichinella pseudospiralis]